MNLYKAQNRCYTDFQSEVTNVTNQWENLLLSDGDYNTH